MNKSIYAVLIGMLLFSACRKTELIRAETPPVPATPCLVQTANPTGRSYESSSVIDYTCLDKHCGLIPLSTKNYWVYEDSIFSNGAFLRVQYDTLRYVSTRMSTTDGLVWWTGNIFVGLPSTIYSNETAFFTLTDRLFTTGVMDARKDYLVPDGDSVKYLASFDDVAAIGRSVRLKETIKTIAGSFSDCLYFEKNARSFRRDQVFFKPGVGVIKYILEKAPNGTSIIKLQQVSTLVSMHIE